MSEEKWEVVWNIFGYKLSWYGEKLYKFIPIHLLLGASVSLPIWAILTVANAWAVLGVWGIIIKIILSVINPLLLGGCIEWTQNDYRNRKWADRREWLLGSVRDVITYLGVAWVVFI
jgi:predicted Na+-dependent transporter